MRGFPLELFLVSEARLGCFVFCVVDIRCRAFGGCLPPPPLLLPLVLSLLLLFGGDGCLCLRGLACFAYFEGSLRDAKGTAPARERARARFLLTSGQSPVVDTLGTTKQGCVNNRKGAGEGESQKEGGGKKKKRREKKRVAPARAPCFDLFRRGRLGSVSPCRNRAREY